MSAAIAQANNQASSKTATPLPRSTELASARRTQAERRQAARQQILAAALICFNRNGYHATSMADIAQQAGVSKGLLHYHFDTKENLAMAVEAQLAQVVFDRITKNIQPLTPSVKQASRALDALWQDITAGKQFVPIGIDLAARAIADGEKKQHFTTLLEGHIDLLKQGIAAVLGPIAQEANYDQQTIADMILVMMAGLAIGHVFIEDEARIEKLFEAFKKMIIMAVLPDRLTKEATHGNR